MGTPRDHIEEIRRLKFSIGGEPNRLTEDLHQAVKNLSAELYAKDVHFLMELIQNAEDNEYPGDVKPSLEFIITSEDITSTGALATLLVFNNEKGFFYKNIESISSVGRSTKKGNRQRGGYIGEKGIGFKSVFLITSRPYIFSNGYHIRFSEEPLPDCDLGYIVPEWVENPTLSDIQQIYGSNKMLPTTTIILPLKSEKVGAVKQQLSSIHPEVLLFLSKIKRLSVREHNKDPNLNTVSAISISSETDFRTRKNVDAESYTLHLSAEEKGNGGESNYYMWKQRFPVKQENRVERRNEVEELVITLAFPYGQRLNSRHSSPGIYAFLPTEMVTNFPFIIQADFVLASSRETILLDNIWNKGILDCVPSAFVNAFISLVKTESAPLSSLPPIFEFLPVKPSSYPELNAVRGSIKAKVIAEHIIPCETYTEQKIFCKPEEVGRIVPAFWNILIKARSQGLSLETLSSHGRYILNYAFDNAEYNTVLEFLEVKEVGYGWYAKCIESSNLVMGITEDVYIELLCFLADNWRNCFSNSDVKKILLLKYVDHDYKVSLWSINSATQSSRSICLSSEPDQDSWLISWNGQFKCAAGRFFIPKSTQEALRSFPRRVTVMDWLRQHAGIDAVNVNGYGKLTISALSNRSLVIAFAHFLYHSLSKCFLSELEVSYLCNSMPLVNSYGHVVPKQNRVLVPAKDSNWLELMGSNLWGNYVELGLDYFRKGHFAGVYSSERELMKFLKTYIKASDIPQLCPPNAVFPAVSSRLTKQNSFLLLDWIRNLKREKIEMPEKFLRCVKEGSWVKTSIGYKPPSESFLSSSAWGNLLQVGSISVDIPLIDQGFYDFRISQYKEELQAIGVMFEFGEACSFIGKHLMSLAASSSLTRSHVLSMLQFIKFLREKYLSPEEFICSVKEGSWLKTSHGFRSPVGSVLFDAGWKAASEISNLPFIDAGYYGKDILGYRTELDLMGVVVGFRQNYQLVADYFRLPTDLTSLTADSVHLILECIRQARSSKQLAIKLKDHRWLKTNLGYKLPAESFLFDPKWGCLLKVVDAIPLIDENFYGSKICSYKNELKDVGIVVCFDEASKAIARHFKHLAFSSCVTKENVHSLLACYKHLKDIGHQFPRELTNCIYEEKWLRTRLGYKSPKESILFNSEWESIAPIAFLPFIDDIFYGKGIYECKDVLKDFGAVVEFKQGSRFVGSSLNIPETACEVTPANVLSLLKCIRYLQEQMGSLPKELMSKVSKKWLKTLMGYQSPDKCILFDSKWSCLLQPEDGPFIDEAFYGSEITSYREELKLIGVTMEAERGCSLLADHLECHINFTVITRIYKYLNNYKWEPDNTSASWIWIPNGRDKGDWVSPKDCVIHDKENLFSSQLHVLDKYYEKELLHFFYMTLNVRNNPTIDSYFKLWKDWEKEQRQLTLAECSAVWVFFAKHWSSNTEKLLTESMEKMEKIPASTLSGEIRLIDKQDVFIPDDLQLKDLFDKASAESLFVWYPQSSLASLSQTKLYDIYSSIGVRTISESIQKDESSNVAEFKKVNPKEALLRNGLFRIILGFLADPSLEMNTERRHQIVGYLRDLSVYETAEPITISYSLPLSSGKRVRIKASQMVRWERENSRLFIQKVGRSTCHKANIEFASYFSEAISEGLLWENTDQIAGLSELIKLGCLLEFEEDAVKFLLRTKNLQLFVEDEELVSSTVALD